ncbi:MAG: hypothetical protein HUJ51_05130 [Eggerthellaceae bacterium]|nr:hypothetical protein [Eggerthellaceae bacterium]
MHLLGLVEKLTPMRNHFNYKTGCGVAVSVADFGNKLKVLFNEIEVKDNDKEGPNPLSV